MPDKYGFDHLPGPPEHRCIEEGCGYPGFGKLLTEAQRMRHHQDHVKNRVKEEKVRKRQAAARARAARRLQEREAALLAERYG